jgi:hypothetical protein
VGILQIRLGQDVVNPAVAAIADWAARPVVFVRQVLRAEPDAWQAEVLEAAARCQRLALKASKGPGKSTVLAWLGWWFLVTRPHPKVVATSITGDNLRDNLWTEMSKWQGRSELLRHAFTWHAERIVYNAHPQTWWMSARQWSKAADASQQADTLAGIHADHVMFLVDEAGGIPDAVVAAAEAGLANADSARGTEAKLVIAGNPTELSGPLYRACTRERSLWWVKEISGDPEDPNRAPRVSVTWAREQIAKYGRENPWVLVNVFGQFPPGQSNALIGVEEVAEASRRVYAERDWRDEVRILGVDVARYGDDRSVLFPRQGRVAFRPRVLRNVDTMQLASQVAMTIADWRPDAVFVDQTGIGAGVVDRLRQLGYAHVVLGVDNAGRPITSETKFLNRRAEMWWQMARWVREGGAIPDDAELMGELPGPTYRFNAQGKLQLESKDDMKARGLPSPDKADALALTFAAPVAHRDLRAAQQSQDARRGMAHDYNPFEAA